MRPSKHHDVAGCFEPGSDDSVNLSQKADHADCGRGIDRSPVGFIIQTYGAAHNRHFEGDAGVAHTLNNNRRIAT